MSGPEIPNREGVVALAQTVSALVHEHAGRLVGVVIGAPSSVAPRIGVRDIETALADVGIDFVDVRIRHDAGPLRLLSAEFER